MNIQDKNPDSGSPIGKILSYIFPERGKFSIISD